MIFDELDELDAARTVIKVIGVGGEGKNTINHLIENEVRGVEFYAVNTDAQDLKSTHVDKNNRVLIGKHTTGGQGAGGKPEVGRAAAIESEDLIHEMIGGAQMVIITCGMGGGTGTGAAPVIARVAKEHGCLTLAVCTKPFLDEGPVRANYAKEGLDEITKYVDTLIVIPNQRLFTALPVGTPLLSAYREADNVLRKSVQGISEIITVNGYVNIDFADIESTMRNKGTALLGIGVGKGPNRAVEAVRQAIHSPILELSLDGATDAILQITASQNISSNETKLAMEELRSNSDSDLNIYMGIAFNNDLGDELVVTVIATGYKLREVDTTYDDIQDLINKNLYTEDDDLVVNLQDEPEEAQAETSKIDEIFESNKSKENKKKTRKEKKEEKKRLKEEKKRNKENGKKEEKKENSNLPDWL